jgi:ankyrin repeat protein
VKLVDNMGDTPLHCAASSFNETSPQRKASVVQVLLDEVADLDAVNNMGETPLHIAAQHGYALVARVLIKAGARVDAPAKGNRTPLWYAAHFEHYHVVQVLLAANADRDQLDDDLKKWIDEQKGIHSW